MLLSANFKLPNMPKNIKITAIDTKWFNTNKLALDNLRKQASQLKAVGVIDVSGTKYGNKIKAQGVAVTPA